VLHVLVLPRSAGGAALALTGWNRARCLAGRPTAGLLGLLAASRATPRDACAATDEPPARSGVVTACERVLGGGGARGLTKKNWRS